jgi:hypothetical protein
MDSGWEEQGYSLWLRWELVEDPLDIWNLGRYHRGVIEGSESLSRLLFDLFLWLKIRFDFVLEDWWNFRLLFGLSISKSHILKPWILRCCLLRHQGFLLQRVIGYNFWLISIFGFLLWLSYWRPLSFWLWLIIGENLLELFRIEVVEKEREVTFDSIQRFHVSK